MLGVRDQLATELLLWLVRGNFEARGRWFLRFHAIDVNGAVRLEVGVDDINHSGDSRVRAGDMPAGWYASMVYRNHALRATRALLTLRERLEVRKGATPSGVDALD